MGRWGRTNMYQQQSVQLFAILIAVRTGSSRKQYPQIRPKYTMKALCMGKGDVAHKMYDVLINCSA